MNQNLGWTGFSVLMRYQKSSEARYWIWYPLRHTHQNILSFVDGQIWTNDHHHSKTIHFNKECACHFSQATIFKKKKNLFSILMLPNRVYLAGCIRVMHKFCMRQLKTAFLKCVKSSCIRKCVGFKNAKFQRLYFNSTVTITLWKQFFSLLWIQEVEHNFSRDIVHFKSPNSRTIFLKI